MTSARSRRPAYVGPWRSPSTFLSLPGCQNCFTSASSVKYLSVRGSKFIVILAFLMRLVSASTLGAVGMSSTSHLK